MYVCQIWKEKSDSAFNFNKNLPTRCHETSLRTFISWIAGMALSMRYLHVITYI